MTKRGAYIILGLVYLFGIIYTFYWAYVTGVSFNRYVDPEFMSGLLTVSSIIFGFSSLIVFQEKKPIEKVNLVVLLIAFFSIIFSASCVIGVALGKGNAVIAILALQASLYANMVSVGFFVSYLRAKEKIK